MWRPGGGGVRRLLQIITVIASEHTETAEFLNRIEAERREREAGKSREVSMLANIMRGLSG